MTCIDLVFLKNDQVNAGHFFQFWGFFGPIFRDLVGLANLPAVFLKDDFIIFLKDGRQAGKISEFSEIFQKNGPKMGYFHFWGLYW